MITTSGKQCLLFRVVQDTDRYIRLRVYKVQGPVCHITCICICTYCTYNTV